MIYAIAILILLGELAIAVIESHHTMEDTE